MKTVLYKDEKFYYSVFVHPSRPLHKSVIKVFKVRTGFFSFFSRYAKIGSACAGKFNGEYDKFHRPEIVKYHLTEILAKHNITVDATPILIDCSPEIEKLYNN